MENKHILELCLLTKDRHVHVIGEGLKNLGRWGGGGGVGRGYPVNSPTCELAYANSPTPNGQLAYVGELTIRRRRVGFLA